MGRPAIKLSSDHLLWWLQDYRHWLADVFETPPILSPWQHEAFVATRSHQKLCIRAARGVGKSTLASLLMLYALQTTWETRILVTAPTQSQLRDVLIAECGLWLSRMKEVYRQGFQLNTERLLWLPTAPHSFATFRTSRPERPETFQGLHAKRMIIICDEASGIEDAIFTAGQGSLSTPGAKIWLMSNPTRSEGYFYNACQSKAWYPIHVPFSAVESQPYVDRLFPEGVAREFGRESDAYRVQVLAEFPHADADTVIPIELVRAAEVYELTAAQRNGALRPIWGLDVARFGQCRTALAKRNNVSLLEPVKTAPWGLDSTEVADWVVEQWEGCSARHRPSEVVVDTVGVGAGVYDCLWRQGVRVASFEAGVSPPAGAVGNHQFRNLKAMAWFRAREWFETRRVSCQGDPKLSAQLLSMRYRVSQQTAKIEIESKQERLGRGYPSPDEADAFVMTFHRHGVHEHRYLED